jgi:REP element-mobilizing transposase RayT
LKKFNYAQAGAYFVTVCTFNKECSLGEVVGGRVMLNGIGKTVQTVWNELPHHFPAIKLDTFVIMPNHLHGILIFTDPVGATHASPLQLVWQRNYHEHIIRNENDLNRIREYIVGNPARWAEDEENPLNVKASLKRTR